jgi:serine/threonine protein kinase/Leucine-rich repeat (LRR) protein
MASVSSSSLVDTLRRHRLLEPAQLQELPALQARFLDPKALAGELIRRGWLTAYQANQLLQGKGQELVLGSYILLERLGEGGMGQVFKARHRNLGRTVAVKLIRKERLDNPDATKRFEREVRATAALNHPNIVRAYDADRIGATHLLVMECVEGATDLNRLVKQNGPLPVEQACEYIRQAALGLQHAYERGLVHRDITPHNLLLTADGKAVKVLDMGLARLDHSGADDDKSSTMTQEGAVMGTPDYIAPEQALESHTVDFRGDLYSLGCTFYYLLIGRVPFAGGTLMEKLLKHRLEEPQPVEKLRPDVPLEVVAILRKMMAKAPEDRYQTPAELATTLAALFGIQSQPPVAASGNDRTVGDDGRAGEQPSQDTLDSAFSYMAKGGDTVAMEAPARQRRDVGKRRWLLLTVAGGALVSVGLAILFLLVLKEPADDKPAQKSERRPVVQNPAVHIPPSKKVPGKVEDGWLKKVAAMPADKQVEAVAAKLKELNPGFDGKVTHKIEKGVVTELRVVTDHVKDISPVRALPGLRVLNCSGSADNKGRLFDLSPLKGMALTTLNCNVTKVADLSPLKGMPLTALHCYYTPVADLSPLKGMPLTALHCGATPIGDLSALQGMPLGGLNCYATQVADLSPVKGMPLTWLNCSGTKVSDLSALKDMKLTILHCNNTPVADLSPVRKMPLTHLSCSITQVPNLWPLKGVPLQILYCDYKAYRDANILRSIKTLETINGKPAKEFWKQVEQKQEAFETWLKKIAAMPSKKQVEAVAAKLKELNPGFDGKMMQTIENGVVTKLTFETDNVADISPVRALPRLKSLTCRGSEPNPSNRLSDLSPLKGHALVRAILLPQPSQELVPAQGDVANQMIFPLYGRDRPNAPPGNAAY